MVRGPLSLTLVLALVAGSFFSARAEPPAVDFVAYIPDVGAEVSDKEAREAIALYADFLRDRGVATAELKIMNDVAELDRYVKARDGSRPAFGVMHPFLVALMAKEWKVSPVAVPLQQGSATSTRVLVTLRGSGIKGVADLKGKSLAITRPWNEMPELLGLLLFGKPDRPDQICSKLLLAETSSQAAAAVLRRKADAALINGYVYRVALKEVKQVWQELELVSETPACHLSPVVVFEGAPPELVASLTAAVLAAKESESGRELLKRFKLDGFRAMEGKDLDAVEGKLLAALRTSVTPITQVRAERMGADVGSTIYLAAPLHEEEKGALVYSVEGGPESRSLLRCASRSCVGMLTAAAGQNVKVRVVAVDGEGRERQLGSYELVAP